MSHAASLQTTIRFQASPSFGPNLVLGDALSPLGTGALSDSATTPVDVSSKVNSVQIRRGRDRVLDRHEAGSCTIVMTDLDGTFDPDNGTYAGEILPMRQLQIKGTHDGTTHVLFSGFIEEWDYRYSPGANAATITVTATDAFRILNLTDVTAVAGAASGDLTGVRIGEILDEISWPSSMRSLSNGLTTCQSDPGTARDVLTAIQAVVDTELGAFFITAEGVTKFMDRNDIVKAHGSTPTVFSDVSGTPDILYQGVDFALDETILANDVTVTAEGGTAQNVVDSASVTSFFQRDLSRTGLLMDTDADALQQATAILAARKTPELRISSITLDVTEENDARITAALDTDFFDPIKVTRTQPGGGVVTRTLSVQGIAHSITPTSWTTTLSTAEKVLDGFILGSATNGVLGTNTFSY